MDNFNREIIVGKFPAEKQYEQVLMFVTISYTDGRLSFQGRGGESSGQCSYLLTGEDIVPSNGWTKPTLKTLADTWNEWHLNDMRPYCSHQKELGWRELASCEVSLYNWTLNQDEFRKMRKIEEDCLLAARIGTTFKPTEDQVRCLNRPLSLRTHTEMLDPDIEDYYEPFKYLYPSDKKFIEDRLLGWLRPDEHPDGLLGKPCPVCGYEYGTKWQREDVPEEILQWLATC